MSLYRLKVLERRRDKPLGMTTGLNQRGVEKLCEMGKVRRGVWIHRRAEILVHPGI